MNALSRRAAASEHATTSVNDVSPRPGRAGRFVVVALGGFVIQLFLLDVLTRFAALDYRAATALAVEAAVLHNFIWHERWTWRMPSRTGSRLVRIVRFHAATTLLSIGGNLVLMSCFVELFGWPVLVANIVAVAVLGVANFRAADRWVFRTDSCNRRAEATLPREGLSANHAPKTAIPIAIGLLFAAALPALAGPPPETAAAWDRYVATTERRIRAELGDRRRFLAMDFEAGRTGRDRRRLLNGEVLVEPVGTGGAQAGSIDVPGGMIHHWRGYVFIPRAQLGAVLSNVSDPTGPRSIQQEDVLDVRVLARQPDGLRLFLKLQRRSLVSVAYNTEHDVRYHSHSPTRASSRSVATKIAELDDVGFPSERELGADSDRGFLWRMNSYWRYEAVPGGVIVELESLTLSRGLPWGTRTAIRPLIERVARESMTRTLVTLADRIRTRTVALSHSRASGPPHL
ncbi:MAG: GtrA family protein [Acidobacteria bacterium]|nr:GtrA family protein [Acidobacteriota bacterium]